MRHLSEPILLNHQDRRTFLWQVFGLSISALATLGLGGFLIASNSISQQTAQWRLIAAARDGDIAGMKWALERGADINGWIAEIELTSDTPEDLMVSALGQATEFNHIEAIKFLLERNADPNMVTPKGYSVVALMHAKSLEAADLLIQYDADPNRNDSGEVLSVLFHQIDRPEVFDFLLRNGADINQKNICGCSLLGAKIAWRFNPDYIKFIISRGAEIENVGNYGVSATFEAARGIIDSFSNEENFSDFPRAREVFFLIVNHPDFNSATEREHFIEHGYNFDAFFNPENLYASQFPRTGDSDQIYGSAKRFLLETA